MTLINLHVYEREIKPRPIYISDCTTGSVSPSEGGEGGGRKNTAYEIKHIMWKLPFREVHDIHAKCSVHAVPSLHLFECFYTPMGEILPFIKIKMRLRAAGPHELKAGWNHCIAVTFIPQYVFISPNLVLTQALDYSIKSLSSFDTPLCSCVRFCLPVPFTPPVFLWLTHNVITAYFPRGVWEAWTPVAGDYGTVTWKERLSSQKDQKVILCLSRLCLNFHDVQRLWMYGGKHPCWRGWKMVAYISLCRGSALVYGCY